MAHTEKHTYNKTQKDMKANRKVVVKRTYSTILTEKRENHQDRYEQIYTNIKIIIKPIVDNYYRAIKMI